MSIVTLRQRLWFISTILALYKFVYMYVWWHHCIWSTSHHSVDRMWMVWDLTRNDWWLVSSDVMWRLGTCVISGGVMKRMSCWCETTYLKATWSAYTFFYLILLTAKIWIVKFSYITRFEWLPHCRCVSVCPSVCLSVCLSQAGTVPK